MNDKQLLKAAKKVLDELESRFDYEEATTSETKAFDELRNAIEEAERCEVLACEASNIGAQRCVNEKKGNTI